MLELGALPLADELAAAFDAEPVAEVVRQHDAEAGEQRVLEVVGEIDQPLADGEPVVHVAEQDELARRAALVGQRELVGPGRRDCGAGTALVSG